SLFFGRKFNGFKDYSEAESKLLTDSELLERIEYLSKVVFPAISEKSKETQNRMVEKFRGNAVANPFPDGSYVMTIDSTRGNKLEPRYEGPFLVVRRTKGGSYILQDLTGALLTRD